MPHFPYLQKVVPHSLDCKFQGPKLFLKYLTQCLAHMLYV